MIRRRQSLNFFHSFEFHVKSSLMQQTNAIQAGLVQALMRKDTIISKLQHENAELLEENKLLVSTIRELDQKIASGSRDGTGTENPDLALKIETLLDEIKLKDEELQRHQETIENFTSRLQIERSRKVESPSNKLKRLKEVSIVKKDPRTKANEILHHEVDGELPKTILIKKFFIEEVRMKEEKETQKWVPSNLMVDSCRTSSSSSSKGTEGAVAVPSSKLYSTSQPYYKKLENGKIKSIFIVCPFKECQKPRKNKEYLKKHLANDHFSMDISKKYTFRKTNAKCQMCEAVINSSSTHYYHYAFVHEELINILDLGDPRRDLLINL